MDSLITAAARALAAGDPLGALKRVALRDDAPALALRGIAMAQLGDLVRAKALLRSAARAFSPRETVARARCLVAEAEIALASRDLSWPVKALEAARAILEAHGDRLNAAHARYLELRRLLLISRLQDAEHMLAQLDPTTLPARVAGRARVGSCRDRAAAPSNQSGARRTCTRPAGCEPSRYPRTHGRGGECVRGAEHAGRTPDRQRHGADPATGRCRKAAGLPRTGCRCVPVRRACRW